jgi:hypothetical protein
MRGMIAAGLFALTAAGPAWAQTAARTIPEINAEIVARADNALGVFTAQADGRVLHVQSGFRCPAAMPSMNFWHAEVFARAGTDVGCDYGRADATGRGVAKLTLFLVKAGDKSLDQVFEGYKAEAMQAMPTLGLKGPALTVQGASPAESPYGEFRSAEFTGRFNGVPTDSQLLVAIRRGWILELRLTYRTEITENADAENLVKDASSAALVFLQSLKELEAGASPSI